MRASGLVERLAAMAGRRLPALSPQQLAETLDALARLQYEAPASFLKVLEVLKLQRSAASHKLHDRPSAHRWAFRF